jgi:transmembrane sensor
MTAEQAKVLLHRFRGGLCSEEEISAIEQWYSSLVDKGEWIWTREEKNTFSQALQERIRAAIAETGPEEVVVTPIRRHRRMWVSFAAAVLLLVIAGRGYVWYRHLPAQRAVAMKSPGDIAPGKTQAVLTLADGSRITLDSARTGQLAVQGKTTVINHNGTITYNGRSAPEWLFNTLSTGRGEQSPPLTLSDGTKVWLNAASSIRFPVAFGGNTRQVEVTGEAYFEVARNAGAPFIVSAGGLTVNVLGTVFNVNAYPDEDCTKTTLISGSVKVVLDKKETVLVPGQQAKVYGGTFSKNWQPAIRVINGDVEQAVAWRNGRVKLTGASIQEVMRQVSRWYDVDVEYQGNVDRAAFIGEVSRNYSLETLLKGIEAGGGVHFTFEGKRIIVKP